MKPFTGHADAVIDAKQRLAVPSKFRGLIDPAVHGEGWYAMPWPDGSLIRLYPEKVFESLASSRVATLTPGSDVAELETTLFGFAEHMTLDDNGRVRIPGRLLEMTQMPGEVVVVGVNTRLEIRDRARWNAELTERFRSLSSLVERTRGSGGA